MRKEPNFRKVCRINGHEILADQDFGIFYYPVLHHRFDILVKDILVLPQAHNLNNRFKLCHDCRRDLFLLVRAATFFEDPVDRLREDYGRESACNSEKGRLVLPGGSDQERS